MINRKNDQVSTRKNWSEGKYAGHIYHAPTDAVETLYSPKLDLKSRLTRKFDYIHLFVKNQAEFHRYFPRLKKYLNHPGMLWVSWSKSNQRETDLNIKLVIKLGYDYGLVESKSISINAVWSTLKFTWPKGSKVYNNSYGKLK